MCIYVDDEPIEIAAGTRRARKQHKCDACSRTIEPRETYRYWTVKGDEDDAPRTWKMCAHCDAAIDGTCAITGCEPAWYWGVIFDLRPGAGEEGGFMRDALDDHDHVWRERPLEKLRVWHWARHGARRWTQPDGTLYEVPA